MKNKQIATGNNNNLVNHQGQGDQIVLIGAQKPKVDLTSSKDISIQGRPFKTRWLLICTIVTFLADLLTVTFGFKQILNGSFIYYLFLACSLLLMVSMGLYAVFQSGGMLRILGKNIVAREGVLKEETYRFSPCPECGGKLFLSTDKENRTVLRCSIYPHEPDHRFKFSPKIFDQSAYSTA